MTTFEDATAFEDAAAEIRSANRCLAGHYRRLRLEVEDLCKALDAHDWRGAEKRAERLDPLEEKTEEALNGLIIMVELTKAALTNEARETDEPRILHLDAAAGEDPDSAQNRTPKKRRGGHD